MPTPTERTLWAQLHAAGVVAATDPPATAGTPWLIQLLLGGCAWFASLFLLGFFGAIVSGLWDSAPGLLVLGVICCGGAAAALRAAGDNPFLGQFVLPLSLAGQFLFSAAFWQFGGSDDAVAGAVGMGLIGTAMACAAPQALHRFLCCVSVLTGICIVLYELHLIRYAAPLMAAASTAVWWYARTDARPRTYAALRPLGYALAPVMLAVASLAGDEPLAALFGRTSAQPRAIWSAAPEAIVLLLVALATIAALLRERGIALATAVGGGALLGATVVASVLLPAPGALAALLLMLLAFAAAERSMLLFGGSGLLLYLGHYYYQLDLTLLQKSIALAASGGVLLILRTACRRFGGALQ